MSKISGPQDFSGQDTGEPPTNPEAEARSNKDASPTTAFVPTLDDPSTSAKSRVFQSDDVAIHGIDSALNRGGNR